MPRRLRCDQAQLFRAKKLFFFCNTSNIKLISAPIDDIGSIGAVERMIETLKHRLEVARIYKNN